MILIKYRLTQNDKLEYIEKVMRCMSESDKNKINSSIQHLLIKLLSMGYEDCSEIMQERELYKETYPMHYYLCMWLVLSFGQIKSIQNFIKRNIIDNDIENKNILVRDRCTEIKSYMDLKKRREYPYRKVDTKVILSYSVEYDSIYKDFELLIKMYKKYSDEDKKINTWIVEKTNIRVCPYCNLTYTYNRGNSTTAQLDHFFNKAEYPMFALCFYNLVPSCPACNRIKSADVGEFTSPYEDNAFQGVIVKWKYSKNLDEHKKVNLKCLEDNIEIVVQSTKQADKNNIEQMKINEAYSQHKDYASELIKKMQIYMNKNNQELISKVCKSGKIGKEEVERFYFGQYLDMDEQIQRPMDKMTRDFLEQYKMISGKYRK